MNALSGQMNAHVEELLAVLGETAGAGSVDTGSTASRAGLSRSPKKTKRLTVAPQLT